MAEPRVRRIGVTMRVEHAAGHGERRDALAHDWSRFLAAVLPEVAWMPIANVGEGVVDLVRRWQLDAYLLSGGNDLATEPVRDRTETCLLEDACARGVPVIGVCRGLQVVQHWLGGPLTACAGDGHLARTHAVTITDGAPYGRPSGARLEVNSYHRFAVAQGTAADGLREFAVADDGIVEGVYHRDAPIVALQWHPERGAVRDADRRLVRRWLGLPA
ncbi:MAG: gamma-glutamyl-gamma-aminobutyrate hydrolase family protein [bacterium]|nr:gamma-glutamyl-gamma-aminobutyrate hydrolase family protein [bacterium]